MSGIEQAVQVFLQFPGLRKANAVAVMMDRVPCVGELVDTQGAIYNVSQVTWNLRLSGSARATITLVNAGTRRDPDRD